MTADEWKQAEKRLSFPGGHVKFLIDGYNIDVCCVPDKPMHYCLAIYIDGIFKGEWAVNDCEIRRKFCFRSKKSLLTAKQKKQLKRERKAVREEVEKKTTYYTYYPFFNSFRSLKSQLTRNCESIEIIGGTKSV